MASEFTLRLKDVLKQGLRPDFRMGRNSLALQQLKNGKPSEFGILPYEAVTNPISPSSWIGNGLQLTWPNPVMHKGEKWTILATNDRFFYVDESDWSLWPLELYDFSSQSAVKLPKTGFQWQFATSHDTWFATNGQSVVFSTNHQAMVGGSKKIYVSSSPTFETCCVANGRFICAGFDPDNFFSNAWSSFIRSYVSSDLNANFKLLDLNLGNNFILYSSIGGGDFPLWLYDVAFAKDSYFSDGTPYSSSKPIFFDKLKAGTWGFMPVSWPGYVRVVKRLGGGFVAYGDNGVSAYKAATVGHVSTYDERAVLKIGVHAHAVGGGSNEHIFIDQRGDLWRIDSQFQFHHIGYREYFYSMLSGEIQISSNFGAGISNEYYICDGQKSFVLTKNGLGETTQWVTSTIFSQGGVLGVAAYPDMVDDEEFLLATDWTDFNKGRGVKRVGWVEVGISTQSGVSAQVAVDYRYRKYEEAKRTRFVPLNREGAAYIGASGIDFRIVVKVSDYRSADVDEVLVHWQHSDRRFVRSGNANTIAA